MVNKKKPNHNPKTCEQRFTSFKNEHCPYCGADGATLVPSRITKKGKVLAYRGCCQKCNAENNFTMPELLERMETLIPLKLKCLHCSTGSLKDCGVVQCR